MKHTVASAILGAQHNWRRKPADYYPTPTEVTVALIRFLYATGLLRTGHFVLEPACGDGSMAAVLEQHGLVVEASDIRFAGYGTPYVDFLSAPVGNDADWVITNPPFSLSVPFIARALALAPRVAMLFKAQYWHAVGRYEMFMDRTPEWILPLTWRPSFLQAERGKNPLMDVIWVVWTEYEAPYAKYRPLLKPRTFIDPPDNFTLAISL